MTAVNHRMSFDNARLVEAPKLVRSPAPVPPPTRLVEPPKLFVVISTTRGGSTESAEIVGMHPCGASFNELLVTEHFPVGYSKYNTNLAGGIAAALNQQIGMKVVGSSLDHHRWLGDALRVRDLFCASRPQPVKDHCGDTCVVALKMHVDGEPYYSPTQSWIKLITSPAWWWCIEEGCRTIAALTPLGGRSFGATTQRNARLTATNARGQPPLSVSAWPET